MVFVGEHEKLRRHAAGLERVEGGETLGDG